MRRKIEAIALALIAGSLPVAAETTIAEVFAAAEAAQEAAENREAALAIGGYDPTLYFAGGLPQVGNASISYVYQGQRYLFTSYQSRQKFIDTPEAYAPQYAGHCAFAMSEHHTVSADPSVFALEDGKLYLFENKMKLDMWKNNSLKFRVLADKRWEFEAKNFSKFKTTF